MHARASETLDLDAGLERRGWTDASIDCAPKLAALAALASLSAPEPVPRVSYLSHGNLLIVAGTQSERARLCAGSLSSSLHVTLLDAALTPAEGAFACWRGRVASLTGYLGEFNALVEGLVTSQGPRPAATPARFDLVLDFSQPPLFEMRQPPQGYYPAPGDAPALDAVMRELREAVGEFEKPRFFAYRENLCAHGRSGVSGCTACVDVCSTRAIASEGDRVRVDPHLCMGCGACATVCPSGAMSYQFPRVPERGEQLKRMLQAYRAAGGADACVAFYDGEGRALLEEAARAGAGLPAHVLPLENFNIASTGLDLLLPALALGAGQVAVIAGPSADREYVSALRFQMELGESLLRALGYTGRRLNLIEAADASALHLAFAALEPAPALQAAASFAVSGDKRTAIEFAVEHLARLAPTKVDEVALPAGAPFGAVKVNQATCTMCMACVGACPESALMDGMDRPLLKFIERNCVQCGLCEATCPEDAITLQPRWLLTPAAREARILNQTEPFHCVSCDKPFGTKQMVEAMMGRLGGHSMFSSNGALRRLQMCADCRVVDMMSNKGETSILKLGAER